MTPAKVVPLEETWVGLAGIEPATSSLSGMRSNRLSYSPGERRKAYQDEPSDRDSYARLRARRP